VTAPELLHRGPAGDRLLALMAAQGMRVIDRGERQRTFSFEEAVLADGDEASVLGHASIEIDPTLPTPAPRRMPTGVVLHDQGEDEPLVIAAGDARSDDQPIPFEEQEDPAHPRRLAPLTLIAAVARNGVIGRGGRLPWDLPEDRAHFERQTLGHAVIMGRRTWDETGAPLPGRRNLVVSRSGEVTGTGREVYRTLAAALEAARTTDADPMVIGGEDIFRQALPLATRMLLTELDFDAPGDRVFPAYDREIWRVTERRPGDRATYVTYERS
jgi:dihydrofolate reductase